MEKYSKHIFEITVMKLLGMGFNSIVAEGGTPYIVGGFVRDVMLGREPKDIDVVIDGMPVQKIVNVLSRYGKVDVVGKSFAVLKFTVKGETIDVAVPRADRHFDGGGHKDVEVITGGLTITDDMYRRDFTINAMAVDFNLNMLDPTGGQDDLDMRVIRCVDSDVFAMDPLRMLRAVVFAVRFGFMIDDNTMNSIKQHAEWIKRIPGERFESELRKVWNDKAKVGELVNLLYESGLYEQMFNTGSQHVSDFNIEAVEDSNMTYADFFYQLLLPTRNPKQQWLDVLRGDISTSEEIGYLYNFMRFAEGKGEMQVKMAMQNAIEHAPGLLCSAVIDRAYPVYLENFRTGKYPKTRLDLAMSGNDLIRMGVAPENRWYVFAKLMERVIGGLLANENVALLKEASIINAERNGGR